VTIRLVLADDNYLLRAGLERLLQSEPDITVVAEASDYDELLAAAAEHHPDVVLTDIRMPPTNSDEGIRAAEHVRREQPGVGVVLLSQYVQPAYVRALLSQGTDGRAYLLKERVADLHELLTAIHEVSRGGSVIDPKVVESLVRVRSNAGGELKRLTPRETEVLGAMAEGKTNAAIADSLVLSRKAVEKHINSIFSKLGLAGDEDAHPRVQAVLLYLAEGATVA
jgi:DNA-binding NarL/FixJ family response regulator